MVDLKQAIANADQFAHEILGDRVEDLSVEEVEFKANEQSWDVTLGFLRKQPAKEPQNPVLRELHIPPRELRTFKVDAESGEVKSFKRVGLA